MPYLFNFYKCIKVDHIEVHKDAIESSQDLLVDWHTDLW